MEFDIDVSGTIKQWPRWKQATLLIATILLLTYGIGFYLWINAPCGVCGN